MPTVTIPAVGESVTEATVSRWLVADGAAVAMDQAIFEIETDKISTEVKSPAAGVIKRLVAEGAVLPVGGAVAEIAAGAVPAAAPAAASAAAPAAAKTAAQPGPAAQKVLAESGIDPAAISGTGKDGRITKGDVSAALAAKPAAPAPATPPAPRSPATAASNGGVTRTKMTSLRARIAQRLVESKNTTAMLTTFNEVDMLACMELRKKWKDDFEKAHGIGLGFMSFFTVAAVRALQKYPLINSQIDGGDIVKFDGIHMGIAVGTEKGLVVPVLRDAQRMGFADVERAIRGYAGKARDGKLTLDDMQGGTFTITNGGVYGSLMSTPIINPPQSGILGMHAIKERPVALNGQVVIRPMMYLALSYDHRIVDGAEAIGFLVRIKELIENPERLILGL